MRISDWSSDVCSSDLTGTLTEGRFGVSDIVLLGEGEENEELALAAAVESQSEHPIAHGIVAEAKDRGLNWYKASDVRNITGEGIVANVGGEDIRDRKRTRMHYIHKWTESKNVSASIKQTKNIRSN